MSSNLGILWRVVSGSLGLVIAALIGFGWLWRYNRFMFAWLVSWLLASGLFLLTHTPLQGRHFVLLWPSLAIAAGCSLNWLRALRKQTYIFFPSFLALALFALNPHTFNPELSVQFVWPQVPSSFPADESEIIDLIKARTKPSDFVVTDQQMQAFYAGRLIPPDLCDTSSVRIESGNLTSEHAIAAAAEAKMIIFWTGRLQRLSGFRSWVDAHYVMLSRSDHGIAYIRKPSVSSGAAWQTP